MRYPCKTIPLQDGSHLYSARLTVSIALPLKNAPRSKRFEAIVDSGASRCIFHASIGRHIGLDVESGQTEHTAGISAISQLYLHEIALYAPGGPVNIQAGFMEGLPVAGLLGMNGFFEHFIVKFDLSEQIFELDRIYRA